MKKRDIERIGRSQLLSELGRRNFADFARAVMPGIAVEGFHRNYYDLLDGFARGETPRLIVTMPPQHGKSTAASILLPAWLLGLNPDLRIVVACYNATLSSRFNRSVQRLIASAAYAAIFPRTRIKAPGEKASGYTRSASEVEIIGHKGSLISVGRGGTLTGSPVDVFILDDLYKDAMEANSPVVRENCWEWYTSVVKSRLHNHSAELIVFTRWHEDDLVGRIAAKTQVEPLLELKEGAVRDRFGWRHLNLEAVKESDPSPIDPRRAGEALWPGRHDLASLEEKRKLDAHAFEALYQGRPCARAGLLYGEGFSTYQALPPGMVKFGNYTDTADAGGDYLCSVCYGVGRDRRIYVTDVVYSGEPMEVTEGRVAQMLASNGTRIALVESNNGGKGFARAVARLTPGVRVEWFHQGANKEARILSNSASVLQNIVMPSDWAARWPEFYRHIVSYRRPLKANRLHDAPDVLTGIVETEVYDRRGRIRIVG